MRWFACWGNCWSATADNISLRMVITNKYDDNAEEERDYNEMVCMLRKLLECNCWSLNSGYGREIGSLKKGCCLESRGCKIFCIAREQRIRGENSCWEAGERSPDTWKAEICFWKFQENKEMPNIKDTRLSDMDLVSSRAYIVKGVRSVWQVLSGLVWSGVQWIIKETQQKFHRNM